MESSNVKKWVKTAGAGALALVLAAPSFAQSRDQRRGDNDRNDRGRSESSRRDNSRNDNSRNDGSRNDNRSYRDNERVTVQGRVTSFSRERDGYRVQLDRNRGSYWVPDSYFHNRGRNRGLQVGISIVLGGIWRGGSVYVDDVNWPDDRGGYYGSDYVAGYVERVDYRRGIAEVRDDRSGRTVVVEFRNGGRYERLSFDDVRRGDYIEVSGAWNRGSVFTAYDIEAIRDGRR